MTTWTPATPQSETWTEKTKQGETWSAQSQQDETWTGESPVRGVFSQLVFSHASYSGKHVFAFGNPAGAEGWYHATKQSETWVTA